VVLVAAAAGPFCLASGCLITRAPVVLTLYIQELTEWAAVEEAECVVVVGKEPSRSSACTLQPDAQRALTLRAAHISPWRDAAGVRAQASAHVPGNLTAVQGLTEHPAFSMSNPNMCYALYLSFLRSTPNFHAADGSGYAWLADSILKARPSSSVKPSLAHRLCRLQAHDMLAGLATSCMSKSRQMAACHGRAAWRSAFRLHAPHASCLRPLPPDSHGNRTRTQRPVALLSCELPEPTPATWRQLPAAARAGGQGQPAGGRAHDRLERVHLLPEV